MTSDTARTLAREARKQRRMKEHVARWEHQRDCHFCKTGMPHNPLGQSLASVLGAIEMPSPTTAH